MYWEKCLQHPLFFAIHIVIVLKVEIFLLSLDDILARNCCGTTPPTTTTTPPIIPKKNHETSLISLYLE